MTRISGGISAARRRSPCDRHLEEPITGICASCLRERLHDLNDPFANDAAPADLRRCKSVISASKCDSSSANLYVPGRMSCDVVSARGSLSKLFFEEDLKIGSESEPIVESKNAGLRAACTVTESKSIRKDRLRGLDDIVGELGPCEGDSENGGEFKTMREYIDLEISKRTRKSKDLKEVAGTLVGAASIVKKLLKWRKTNKEVKKPDDSGPGAPNISGESKNIKFFHYRKKLRESHSPVVGGRRSCDTGLPCSLDTGLISFEQPRASWDGYMIARTIPRLAPMFSAVDSGILGNAARFERHGLFADDATHSTIEEKSRSGATGSSHSNSDSSSSMRRSSFDRSTSARSCAKKLMGREDCGVSPANVKLVITEKELKDWNLSSSRDNSMEKVTSSNTPALDSLCNSGASANKTVPWRRMRNAFGFRVKNKETVVGNAFDECSQDMEHMHMKEGGGNLQGLTSYMIGSMDSFDAVQSAHCRRSVDGLCSRSALNGHGEDCGLKRNNSANHSSHFL